MCCCISAVGPRCWKWLRGAGGTVLRHAVEQDAEVAGVAARDAPRNVPGRGVALSEARGLQV